MGNFPLGTWFHQEVKHEMPNSAVVIRSALVKRFTKVNRQNHETHIDIAENLALRSLASTQQVQGLCNELRLLAGEEMMLKQRLFKGRDRRGAHRNTVTQVSWEQLHLKWATALHFKGNTSTGGLK